VNHALLEETREMNRQLIQLLILVMRMLIQVQLLLLLKGVKKSVKCSFIAVPLSPSLKSQYASARMSPSHPLRLLVPTNYPNFLLKS
ncbi:hypothetical protein UlMin_028499, partial [Ulmus minor]